jgi:cell division protein FtsB
MPRRRRRPARSALALRWLGVAVLVAIGLSYIHPLRGYQAAQARVKERRVDLAALQRENTQLERRLALSGKDSFLEREARRIGLVRPGERLYIVKGVEEWRRASVR